MKKKIAHAPQIAKQPAAPRPAPHPAAIPLVLPDRHLTYDRMHDATNDELLLWTLSAYAPQYNAREWAVTTIQTVASEVMVLQEGVRSDLADEIVRDTLDALANRLRVIAEVTRRLWPADAAAKAVRP